VDHRRALLFQSPGISVVDFRCRAHVEPSGPEEPNPTHSIVFIRRGVFGRTYRRSTIIADANHVLFFNQAEPYRFCHPLPGGDDCTILAPDASVALEVVARYAPVHAERSETPFRLEHGLCLPHAARLHYELLALIRSRALPLAIEDVLSELIDQAVRNAYALHSGSVRRGSPSAAARRRHRDLAEDVKLAVNTRLETPPRLGELARLLGCSPFHLSRTFQSVMGVSLRRYVGQLRARAAADRLTRCAQDLTELALRLGYADHSHFTNAFRRAWGVPPSRFRARRDAGRCAS
jgi:AraC family transcriptional regulator